MNEWEMYLKRRIDGVRLFGMMVVVYFTNKGQAVTAGSGLVTNEDMIDDIEFDWNECY